MSTPAPVDSHRAETDPAQDRAGSGTPGRAAGGAPMRAVALRLLGSAEIADEVLRTAADPGRLSDVAALCLDRLRSRESRRPAVRDPLDASVPPAADVLDVLTPSERIAFVLHEDFGVPYDDIAPVVERTPAAVRQLAARARRRVEGTEEMPAPDPERQRQAVTAFLAAARADDAEALVALLDPDAVLRADSEAVRNGATPAHGARAVAHRVAGRLREARPALVDGATGLLWAATDGTPKAVLRFTVLEDRVTAVDALADPQHLDRLRLGPPDPP
ncbi:sigma factor-like helix-turn-helix DNA-binding protein [Streptomyces roseicoloratus]|uniref:sigma factor-like helix-turn-helix DNA-binding protein n=1 Tax=Streptomyces roseicoloratus TaxID=2508722 RepID=UPI001FE98EFB|nr:sigma factor-like helix-turn-helix DNA-binding protein [Streptomyces roseicoloratus]